MFRVIQPLVLELSVTRPLFYKCARSCETLMWRDVAPFWKRPTYYCGRLFKLPENA